MNRPTTRTSDPGVVALESRVLAEAVSLALGCVLDLVSSPADSQDADAALPASASRASEAVEGLSVTVTRIDDPWTGGDHVEGSADVVAIGALDLVVVGDRRVARIDVVWPMSAPRALSTVVATTVASTVVAQLGSARMARDTPRRVVAADADVMRILDPGAPDAPGDVAEFERRLDRWIEREASSPLTSRERQVVLMLLQGHRTSTISSELFLSRHTVRNHLKRIFAKLSVHSQAELASRFHTHDLGRN